MCAIFYWASILETRFKDDCCQDGVSIQKRIGTVRSSGATVRSRVPIPGVTFPAPWVVDDGMTEFGYTRVTSENMSKTSCSGAV